MLHKESQYFVYWIHLEEHNSVLNQGYVGITHLEPRKRFEQHVKKSKQGKYTIHKAIRKYGNRLKLTVLMTGSREEVLETERRLRPKSYTAWNINVGGGGNQAREWSSDSKAKLSKSLKETFKKNPRKPRKVSEETKLKLSKAKSGKAPSYKTKAAQIESQKLLQSWERSRTDRSFWLNADKYYSYWKIDSSRTGADLGRHFEMPRSKFLVILKKFKSGWVPENDNKWLQWASKFK